MIKLLFVEDDEHCAYAVQGGLELFDIYDIRRASNGKEALDIYDEFCPDVVVSDVEMPGMNGFELAQSIRSKSRAVVLLLATGLVTPKDVDQGYKIGIDEYVKKPYIANELHQRIQAILRRTTSVVKTSSEDSGNTKTQSVGNYLYDVEAGTLIHEGKISQKLTPLESALLRLLLENKNQLMERSEILKQLWEKDDPAFASRSLDVFVSKLRSYLSKDAAVSIETVRNKGLRLIAKVKN